MTNLIPVDMALIIHALTPSVAFGILCTVIVTALYMRKQHYEALVFLVTFILTSSLVVILKHTFAVPRPEQAIITLTDYAFPSSHAALSMCLATLLGWLFLRRRTRSGQSIVLYQTLIWLPAVIIGFSRLSLGVHTPFQVGFGFLIGIFIPVLVIYFAEKKRRHL